VVDRPKIGVLALQGDVEKHMQAAERAGGEPVEVRTAEALAGVDALILPGGESTTQGKLLERYELMEPLRRRTAAGMPVLGTCTGLILLAREILGSDQPRIGALDVAVARNAYGRQVDSFEADVSVPALGAEPVRAIFIRAPVIERVGPEVEILAEAAGKPVLVRQDRILGCAFHPELTDDSRVHAWLVRMAQGEE
jgi:pyridoxal 5'-phosphate synthase pdxT subunit